MKGELAFVLPCKLSLVLSPREGVARVRTKEGEPASYSGGSRLQKHSKSSRARSFASALWLRGVDCDHSFYRALF